MSAWFLMLSTQHNLWWRLLLWGLRRSGNSLEFRKMFEFNQEKSNNMCLFCGKTGSSYLWPQWLSRWSKSKYQAKRKLGAKYKQVIMGLKIRAKSLTTALCGAMTAPSRQLCDVEGSVGYVTWRQIKSTFFKFPCILVYQCSVSLSCNRTRRTGVWKVDSDQIKVQVKFPHRYCYTECLVNYFVIGEKKSFISDVRPAHSNLHCIGL